VVTCCARRSHADGSFVAPAVGTMPGRQPPHAQTRLVADERVLLCNRAIPAARSAVVSRCEMGLVLQETVFGSIRGSCGGTSIAAGTRTCLYGCCRADTDINHLRVILDGGACHPLPRTSRRGEP
jgi:hypothetical protein